MMAPALTRNEMNNADDIIREVGVVPIRRRTNINPKSFGSQSSSCEGKTPFATKVAAGKSARRGTVAYRCKYCRFWHVGGASKMGDR
ncbi:hypothetical protein [Bradyrhizobium prioriisuperbiae]|uniref:hypothetical protein n=1 Tax=Bradyrhizobium prioriisuperbiae TaxID=2854389 RepID=UPI0028E628E0|nr:hypothetical protein [Bradyrhizobium prioritasuperba]